MQSFVPRDAFVLKMQSESQSVTRNTSEKFRNFRETGPRLVPLDSYILLKRPYLFYHYKNQNADMKIWLPVFFSSFFMMSVPQ